jgi:RNA polymerase sigma-70 factor (ECF subfamily)
MLSRRPTARFEAEMLPHLPAAWRLARWLTGSATDADDAVQEAMLKACHAFDQWRGISARAWLLAIVRTAAIDVLRRRPANLVPFDQAETEMARLAAQQPDALATLAARRELARVRTALAGLPAHQREVLVLRELEGLSYREIAEALAVPEGTVMSRLSRARDALAAQLREPPVSRRGEGEA